MAAMAALVAVVSQVLVTRDPVDVSLWTFWLFEDDWTDVLAPATTLTVDWSTDAGLTWRSLTVAMDWLEQRRRAVANIAKRFADGTTEYLVRFTVDGVVYGPWVMRFTT